MVERSLPRVFLLVACVALLLIGPPVVAKTDVWSASLLSSPSNSPAVFAQEINESGKITGFYYTWTGETHAVVWASPSSSPVDLGPLSGDTQAWSADVNASGTVCGSSVGLYSRAVTWDDKGNVTDRSPADWDNSEMWSLNDKGEAVGRVWGSGPPWACYWPKKGDAVLLDEGTGYSWTEALSINKNGLISGNAWTAGPPRACYWDGPDGDLVNIHDAIEDAAGVGLRASWGYEATDNGEIVGVARTTAFLFLAYVYTPGKGATILSDGGEGESFAWQSAGKYLVGGIGGDWNFNGDLKAGVWERGTSKGGTTWTLHKIANISGYELIAAGVNQEGCIVGAGADKDGYIRAWYAKRSGK